MNKKMALKSFAIAFIMFSAFAGLHAFTPVSQVSKKATVSFTKSMQYIAVISTQTVFVLDASSFPVSGNIIMTPGVTINSVKIEYTYDTSTPPYMSVSTDSYNVDGSFTALVTPVVPTTNYVFYRIAVEYSKDFLQQPTVYSQWYTIKNPVIMHLDIQRISPYQLNVVVKGAVSGSFVTKTEMEYYVDSDSTTITTVATNNQFDFTTNPVSLPVGTQTFAYRLVVSCDNSDPTQIKYHPSGDTWIEVPVLSSAAKTIGAPGGSLLLDNEDQRYGKSLLTVPSAALTSDVNIVFTECDIDGTYIWPPSKDIVKIYKIDPELHVLNSANGNLASPYATSPADLTLYYGANNNGKYVIKFWDGTAWVELTSVQDMSKKTVSAKVSQLGYFAIFASSAKADNEYRPDTRSFMPGEKIQFKNLSDGDSVTIYNLRGKQVRKISSDPFEWDGRTDGGGYAESGSYIYQIKVNGKIISGSLALIR